MLRKGLAEKNIESIKESIRGRRKEDVNEDGRGAQDGDGRWLAEEVKGKGSGGRSV